MNLDPLSKINDVLVLQQEDLTKYNTLKLAAIGDLIIIKSLDALKSVLSYLKQNSINYKILGLGANQVLSRTSIEPYILLDFSFNKEMLSTPHERYVLPASVRLAVLTSHATKFGLKGWEVFTGIPATIGGAIAMNAGTGLGEICQVIRSVKYISSDGNLHEHQVDSNSFSYRSNNFLQKGDIVYEATLFHNGTDPKISETIREYLKKRNEGQPMKANTCGCVFKNPSSFRAGQLIDQLGLKGLTYKGLKISHKHANFIENYGDASFEDFIFMVKWIQELVFLYYGIHLETEVKLN